MKTGPNRKYTTEFRDAAVKQVVEGRRTVAAVARSLEMSSKSLANWICAALRAKACATICAKVCAAVRPAVGLYTAGR